MALNKSFEIDTYFDHRICMSAFVISQIFGNQIKIKNCNSVATSFPNFFNVMKQIGAKYSKYY